MKKKSVNYYMRSLHRDIGFFVIGLTIIYSISGIALIYRETNFLKHEVLIEKELSSNMELSELGNVLHIRKIKLVKTEGETIYFQNGTYNQETGIVKYSSKELPSWLNKFNGLHKSSNRSILHWFTTIYGILLFFLAISSFWMFKPKTKYFRRGILFAGSGILIAIILFFI